MQTVSYLATRAVRGTGCQVTLLVKKFHVFMEPEENHRFHNIIFPSALSLPGDLFLTRIL